MDNVVWALGVFFKARLFEVGLMKIAATHESQNIPATYLHIFKIFYKS
jgi:hypothetical protein